MASNGDRARAARTRGQGESHERQPATAGPGLTIHRTDQARRRQTSRSGPRRRYASAMTAFDEALARIDGWGAGHAAAAVVGAGRRHRDRAATPSRPSAGRRSPSSATALAVLVAVDRRLGGPRRGGGTAGLDGPSPAGPRLGAAVRGSRADLGARPAADLFEPGLRRCSARSLAERAGVPFETVLDAHGPEPARDGADSPAGAAVAGPPRAARRPRQARCRAPAADPRLRASCSPKRRPSPFPG